MSRNRQTFVAPNFLDRMIGVLSPGRAVERIQQRTVLASMSIGEGGYRGGKRGRRATKNFMPGEGSADGDLLPDLATLRGRSRDLARNMPVVAGAIATKKTHVVGDGLNLNAHVKRDLLDLSEDQAGAMDRLIEAEWSLFCQGADFTRVQQMGDLQYMLYGGVKESGDIFVIRRFRPDAGEAYGTRLQVIEADRICNPFNKADTDTLVAGIEHDASGVPVAVHVANRHPGDLHRRPTAWRRVPMRYNDGRRIVLHLFERVRPGQTRGIPLPSAVIEELKRLHDYEDAEIAGAVTAAMFTAFITSTGDEAEGPLPSTGEGSLGKPEIEMGNGAVVDLAPGEDVTFATPGRPNPQFEAFVTAFLRQIGVALELPYELLVKHFQSSYSASRAALEIAYHSFRRERNWLVRTLMQPVYEWFFEEAVLAGRLAAPGYFEDPLIRSAWLSATWTGPVRISLDPLKEAKADETDIKNLVKTRQQVMTERTGGDFDQKADQLGREERKLKESGAKPEAPAAPAAGPPTDPKDDLEDDPEATDKEGDEE